MGLGKLLKTKIMSAHKNYILNVCFFTVLSRLVLAPAASAHHVTLCNFLCRCCTLLLHVAKNVCTTFKSIALNCPALLHQAIWPNDNFQAAFIKIGCMETGLVFQVKILLQLCTDYKEIDQLILLITVGLVAVVCT